MIHELALANNSASKASVKLNAKATMRFDL